MGFLTEGHPLEWTESLPYLKQVKADGIAQFLHVYKTLGTRRGDVLKWGDEVEYIIVKKDTKNKRVLLSLRAPEIIKELQEEERHSKPSGSTVEVLWRPEYANWMVEGTPGVPYRCFVADLELVEHNMALRRREVQNMLHQDEFIVSLPAFPRLGCGVFTDPPSYPMGPAARSFFVSDDVINPHPRFATLTRNIRLRRKSKVNIRVPLFMDEHTPATIPIFSDGFLEDPLSPNAGTDDVGGQAQGEDMTRQSSIPHAPHDTYYDDPRKFLTSKIDDVYLDAMAFGMGACCLQVTVQARDIHESRLLYDQLAVLGPIFLALSAGTPIQRGYLLDTDVRWHVISESVDDRTEEERNGLIAKSRYDSISCFISDSPEMNCALYNDIPLEINGEAYEKLRAEGVDELLARHVAHLFIRDPLVIYREKINLDNTKNMDHFENIQSTNWNSVRFKPPPLDSDIGWRVEFRTMDIQLTDFENAALAIFVVLVSRVILSYNLNLYMPLSKVDANFAVAHERNACKEQKFSFRRNIFRNSSVSPPESFLCSCGQHHQTHFPWQNGNNCECTSNADMPEGGPNCFELMSMNEIINGRVEDDHLIFPGLIPLIKGYLEAIDVKFETRKKILTYLDFISARASGELMTLASWMRHFVENHPAYERDSRVSEIICYDMFVKMHDIETGAVECPELFGTYYPDHRTSAPEDSKVFSQMRDLAIERNDATLRGQSMSTSAVIRGMAHTSHVAKTHAKK
mmetsp:Transcript_14707/g.25439  ORF Transcript_14707/g.25439 Transcript_14707/m.25439 type:complete len:743 (-) Transcript_14707:451-2679(-)|eukprot:CAMPEP_0184697194 /NCGR_PEP_ID=MMETSP0313-20130426/4229_1 /TAXON_ID=2792 /ORGANISM="Porphyridium aerugineum, Strain SAG 1380-2" /LENGTH=742 /DNA_ID=CAMNT_0027155957 /DNA_START=402 /DNA_END=2630 /DNA_ORIENTATION=-